MMTPRDTASSNSRLRPSRHLQKQQLLWVWRLDRPGCARGVWRACSGPKGVSFSHTPAGGGNRLPKRSVQLALHGEWGPGLVHWGQLMIEPRSRLVVNCITHCWEGAAHKKHMSVSSQLALCLLTASMLQNVVSGPVGPPFNMPHTRVCAICCWVAACADVGWLSVKAMSATVHATRHTVCATQCADGRPYVRRYLLEDMWAAAMPPDVLHPVKPRDIHPIQRGPDHG